MSDGSGKTVIVVYVSAYSTSEAPLSGLKYGSRVLVAESPDTRVYAAYTQDAGKYRETRAVYQAMRIMRREGFRLSKLYRVRASAKRTSAKKHVRESSEYMENMFDDR